MPQLTDTQSLLLATAAQRGSGSLLPLPSSITAPAGGIAKSLPSLVKKGWAVERQTSDAAEVSRTDGELRFGLYVTAADLSAIGIADEGDDNGGYTPPAPPAGVASVVEEPTSRVTKTSGVLSLLSRDGGATLPELVEATGCRTKA